MRDHDKAIAEMNAGLKLIVSRYKPGEMPAELGLMILQTTLLMKMSQQLDDIWAQL